MESPKSYFQTQVAREKEVLVADEDSTSPSPASPLVKSDETSDVDNTKQQLSSLVDTTVAETPAEPSAEADSATVTTPELPYNYTRINGLGTLNVFADWMIMKILRLLDPDDLICLSLVSRAFYIYSDENDLWKDLCIRKHGGNFRLPKDLPPHLQVPRRSGLTVREFIEEYVKPNKPVILTDVVTKWPAWKEKSWTREALIKRFPDTPFRVDQTDDAGQKLNMTLADYFQYCDQTQDEDPIYVFCPLFGDRAYKMLEDYEVPPYFPEDLFSLMESERPFYRWIVIGGPRSGSPFHLDPFKTSAWNALLAGRKRWVLYPPEQLPPSGVDIDEDEDTGELDYTGEDPIVWFLEHYPLIKNREPSQHPVECILEAGEVIFVPTNWWHMVFNLTETIAVTQNFCDSHNFPEVYKDLSKDKEFDKGLYMFTEKMLMMRPDLMANVTLPKSYWKRKEKYRLKEAAKREELRRREEETTPATTAAASAPNSEWVETSFWRVPPSLDALDEEERDAILKSHVHVPPLSLASDSSSSESESSDDSDSDESDDDETSSQATATDSETADSSCSSTEEC